MEVEMESINEILRSKEEKRILTRKNHRNRG